MPREIIRSKKVRVIRMFVGSMKKTLEAMEKDIKEYDGIDKVMLEASLDAHFEKLRCDSGNLNQVLEDNRMALAIFIESIEIDQKVALIADNLERPEKVSDETK